MYKNIHSYIPFQHDNIEFKDNLINFARVQNKTTPEGAFSAVLIYANVIDYLARHLLENLLKMVSVQSYVKFGAVLFLDGQKKRTNLPLGELCRELRLFEFPSKEDFLGSLQEFNKLRIDVMHKLMELDPSDTTRRFDTSIVRIGEIAEDLLAKYGAITSGLTTAWNTAISTPTQTGTSTSQTPIEQNEQTVPSKSA